MAIHRGRLFRSGTSQAVRRSKAIAFDGESEVYVVRSGDVVTIYRAELTVAAMAEPFRLGPSLALPTRACPAEIRYRNLRGLPVIASGRDYRAQYS